MKADRVRPATVPTAAFAEYLGANRTLTLTRTCQACLLPWESSISEVSRCIRGWSRRLKSSAFIFGRRPELGLAVCPMARSVLPREDWTPLPPSPSAHSGVTVSSRDGHAPLKRTVALRTLQALLHAGPTHGRHHDGQPTCRRRERTVSAGAQRGRHVAGGLPKMQSPRLFFVQPPIPSHNDHATSVVKVAPTLPQA